MNNGVYVVLACTHPGCDRQHSDHPTLRLNRLGGIRLHLSAHDWYVDGGTVRCPDHVTDSDRDAVHSDSWEDMEIRHVCDQLGIRAFPQRRTVTEWHVERLDGSRV